MTAELAECEGGTAAQVVGHVDSSAYQHVNPQSRTGCRPDVEDAAGRNVDRRPGPDLQSVHSDGGRCAGDADNGGLGESQRGAGHRALESSCSRFVAECLVAKSEGQVVHRA